MIEGKIKALKGLIENPKDLNGLIKYERKLRDASTDRLNEIRKQTLNIMKSGQKIDEISKIVPKIKERIESLVQRSANQSIGITPGITELAKKHIIQGAVIYNLVIFSRCWDTKNLLNELDSKVVFEEEEPIKDLLKKTLNTIHALDDLYTSRENSISNAITPEDLALDLSKEFKEDLEGINEIGAFEGIVILDKPKLFGKSKYYEKLGNIILKLAHSIHKEIGSDIFPVSKLAAKLNSEYPEVSAEINDTTKALENLSNNGLLLVKEEEDGLRMIQLYPSEYEANTILSYAKKKKFITLESLMLETNWSPKKAQEEMDKFIQAGCAVVDSSYSEGTKYYFPGLNEE